MQTIAGKELFEANWQRTFDAVPQAVFVLDNENRIQRANRAAGEMLGLELSQLLGKHCYEVLHKTAEPPPHCPHKTLLQCGQGGRGELAEPTLEKVFDTTSHPIHDEQGTLVGSVYVLSDITEHKRAEEALQISEERYRRLFEAAKDGILLVDFDTGAITDVNQFLIDLLGYSRQEILQKKLWELGFLADVLGSQIKFAELQAAEYVRYEDLPLKTRDGRAAEVEFVSNVYQSQSQGDSMQYSRYYRAQAERA